MTTTTAGPATQGTQAPERTPEHVVSAAGAPLARGTWEDCFHYATVHITRHGCTIMSALEHARTWPETALVPYAPDAEWLAFAAAATGMRSWADGRNTPGISCECER